METVADRRVRKRRLSGEKSNSTAKGHAREVCRKSNDFLLSTAFTRLQSIVSNAFTNVDIDDYVNSFRR